MNLTKDYGSIPSTESEAYVLGFLGLTTVKANVPAFMHFGGELDSDTQEQLIKIGSELLHGTITAEQYVDKYEKALIAALPKDKQKDVSFDDYTKEQLKMRVFYSHGLHSKDRKTLKEERTLVARTLTSQGYLKKYKNSDGTYSYYRSVIKIDEPEYNEILNRTKSGKSESIEEGLEPESKDYMRIRDIMYKGKTREQRMALANNMANKITDRDKAFRRYRAAEDENLHDLALVFYKRFAQLDKLTPLKEAVDHTATILNFLKANPHATYNKILDYLAIDPKSGSAIPIYHQVKALLTSGKIQREKVGKGFAYSVAGTPAAPQPISNTTPTVTSVSKYSIREPERVLQIWGNSKQEALSHIQHELEYTESLLDMASKPEHKAKIQQRIADLQTQKDTLGVDM